MKISEAIKLGAMLRPQAFGAIRQTRSRVFGPDITETCALGAAFEAAGVRLVENTNRLPVLPIRGGSTISDTCYDVPGDWFIVMAQTHPCPSVKCKLTSQVQAIIHHLNDDHRWSRERIADWVATVEPQEVSPETVVEEEACVGR